MIIDGWPEDASDVPKNLRKYFSHASTLTVEDELILQGEALLIQETEWAQVLQQLHDEHWGITKMNLWAKNVIYWPGMTKDIEQMINCCNTCQHFRQDSVIYPREAAYTRLSMADCGFRSFYFDGGQYMVMADMYSEMCFVWENAFCWSNISSHYW